MLQWIVDARTPAAELVDAVEAACRGGVDQIQVRNKAAPADELYAAAQAVLPVVTRLGCQLLVNDRLDVALVAGAHGVHLAGRSLPTRAVKRAFPQLLVGRSVHSLEEALQAQAEGADYITFGHVFATSSKPGRPPRGVGALAAVIARVKVPVLAIGGITEANAAEVVAAGAAGVAVISAIAQAGDIFQGARRLREALDRAAQTLEVKEERA